MVVQGSWDYSFQSFLSAQFYNREVICKGKKKKKDSFKLQAFQLRLFSYLKLAFAF